jgi:hypothetical protein
MQSEAALTLRKGRRILPLCSPHGNQRKANYRHITINPALFVKHIANKAKDVALRLVARWIVNKFYLKKLGQMTKLQLDSEKQEIYLALDLHGEQSPIELAIHYRLLSSNHIEIANVWSSREWIAALVNEMVPAKDKQITVPAGVTAALSKIIR